MRSNRLQSSAAYKGRRAGVGNSAVRRRVDLLHHLFIFHGIQGEDGFGPLQPACPTRPCQMVNPRGFVYPIDRFLPAQAKRLGSDFCQHAAPGGAADLVGDDAQGFLAARPIQHFADETISAAGCRPSSCERSNRRRPPAGYAARLPVWSGRRCSTDGVDPLRGRLPPSHRQRHSRLKSGSEQRADFSASCARTAGACALIARQIAISVSLSARSTAV